MRRIALVGSLASLACGPSSSTTAGDADTSASGASSPSSSTTDSGDTSTSTTSTSTTSVDATTSTVDTTAAETSDTGVVETCTPGTFVGLYSVGGESSDFESCDTGESWAFLGPGNRSCPLEMWVTVEGELCGPGAYGHLGAYEYRLTGDIVQGPCDASCGDAPEPEACSSFLELCPFYECDPSTQDCPEDQRCTPVSASGSAPWTGTTCTPIDGPAQPIGDACTSDGGWHHDCVAQAHCVPTEGASGAGTCAALCNATDVCEVGTCWPCDFADDAFSVGVCSVDDVAC